MTGAPSNGRKKSKIGLSQKILQSLKILPSPEPRPEVTAPRYSDVWMEEVDTRNEIRMMNELLRRRALKSAQESASQAASEPAKTKQAKA